MKRHTRQAPLFFVLFVLTACFPAAPAFAQTGVIQNPDGGYNIDIIQGIDTIENQSGQVLAVENNLAISSPLSPNEEMLIADPNFMVPPILLSNGPPGASLSAYATANLPSFIGYPDDNTVLNAILLDPTSVPSLLLTTQGNLVTLPPVLIGNGEGFLYNGVFADLTGNAPAGASVVSSNITLDFGNTQVGEFYTANNVEIDAVENINYNTYNIVEKVGAVVPEASSLVLLAGGLAGFGLFAWSRRRRPTSG